MNASAFSELLTDISDEYIVSAANPRIRSVHRYQVTAIAAGIVLLIAAAVYPKLRSQMPEVTEPPAAIITTETTAQNTAETTAGTVYTTVVNQEVTHHTTAKMIRQTVTETAAATPTAQASETIQTVPIQQYETKSFTLTKQETGSAGVTETTAQQSRTIPVTVRKTHTSSILEIPNGAGDVRGDDNPPPGAPESPNEPVKPPVSEEPKAKITDEFDYYSVSFYDITADAALLSGQYDGRILSLQFLRLEYAPDEGIPLIEETVVLQLELPDDLKGHIEEVRADVSVTTDAAAFAEASEHEPEIIVIPRKEGDL